MIYWILLSLVADSKLLYHENVQFEKHLTLS